MKIAVIGCGYVGAAVAALWKQQGHQVTATTTRSSRLEQLTAIAGSAQLLIGSQPHTWHPLLEQHQTLLLSIAPSSHSSYSESYLETVKTLKTLLQANRSISQILYTSSTSVYGSHEGVWVDESSSLHPEKESNAEILRQTEEILLDCAGPARQVIVFRLGEIVGPGREIRSRLLKGSAFPGDGSAYTHLIHIEDITRALDFALNKKLSGIYNLCNDLRIPRKELYKLICQKHQLPDVQWDPTRASSHTGNKRVSNQKIKAEGFQFLHGCDYE